MSIKIMSVANGISKRTVLDVDCNKIKLGKDKFSKIEAINFRLPSSTPWPNSDVLINTDSNASKKIVAEKEKNVQSNLSVAPAYEKKIKSFGIPSYNNSSKKTDDTVSKNDSVPPFVPSIKTDDDPSVVYQKVNAIIKLNNEAKEGTNVKKLSSGIVEIINKIKNRISSYEEEIKKLTEASSRNEDAKNTMLKKKKQIESKINYFDLNSFSQLNVSSVSGPEDECLLSVNESLLNMKKNYDNMLDSIKYLDEVANKYSAAKDENEKKISDLSDQIKLNLKQLNDICNTGNENYKVAKDADIAKENALSHAAEQARLEAEEEQRQQKLQQTLDYQLELMNKKAGADETDEFSGSVFDNIRVISKQDVFSDENESFFGRAA